LELDLGAGVTGLCWRTRRIQLVDFAEVRERAARDSEYIFREWMMRPLEYESVRQTVRAVLSVPIFRSADYISSERSKALIGVINIDSDNIKEEVFENEQVIRVAETYAEVISNLLDL